MIVVASALVLVPGLGLGPEPEHGPDDAAALDAAGVVATEQALEHGLRSLPL